MATEKKKHNAKILRFRKRRVGWTFHRKPRRLVSPGQLGVMSRWSLCEEDSKKHSWCREKFPVRDLEGFPWRTSPKKPFETLDVLSMEFPIGWYIAYWVIIYHRSHLLREPETAIDFRFLFDYERSVRSCKSNQKKLHHGNFCVCVCDIIWRHHNSTR